jgi:hypothetical protein
MTNKNLTFPQVKGKWQGIVACNRQGMPDLHYAPCNHAGLHRATSVNIKKAAES